MRYGRCAVTGTPPYYIVGVSVSGKRGKRTFFCCKAFCHSKKLINFAFEKKVLYNIIIQHKTSVM